MDTRSQEDLKVAETDSKVCPDAFKEPHQSEGSRDGLQISLRPLGTSVDVAADLTAKLQLRRCQSRTERSAETICCLQHSNKTYLWTQSKEQ